MRSHRRQTTRLPRPWDSPGKNTGVGCHFLLQCMKVKSESEVAQSCSTFHDPMDCRLPGSSVHGIFQARVLEWGAIAVSISITNFQQFDFVVALCTFLHAFPTWGLVNFLNQCVYGFHKIGEMFDYRFFKHFSVSPIPLLWPPLHMDFVPPLAGLLFIFLLFVFHFGYFPLQSFSSSIIFPANLLSFC